MKEEKKDRNGEIIVIPLDIQPSGDIDDFIFEDEGYKCSER